MHHYPQHINKLKTQQTLNRPVSQIQGFSGIVSPYKQSQVNNFNTSPYMIHPSQRISTVSSQKMSIATRIEPCSKVILGNNYTPKSSIIVGNSPRKIFNPQSQQINYVVQNNSSSNLSYRNNQHSRSLSQHQLQIGVNKGIPSFSQQIMNPYLQTKSNPYRQSTFTNNFLNKSMQTSLIVSKQLSAKQPVIKPNPVKKQATLLVQKTKPSNKIESQNKSTVVKSGETIIGNVTVQNIQLPPKIRNVTRQNNRLYKSAVFGENDHNLRPISRAHSTFSHQEKTKKRDIYIRRPHRTFISDKKIPIIGGYVSKDKSKSFVVRQMSGLKCPKVLSSKILTMQLIDVIPTQVIKIPIGKAQGLRQSQANSSMMFDDNHSISSNPIIDQPTLIKQYSPEKSVRSHFDNNSDSLDRSFYSTKSKRLGDNIKISVYRSPDVIVKKAETITSGPKLTKQHILRVAAEGKVVSPEKYENLYKKQKQDSSKKSLSPTAKYEYESNQYDILSKTPKSNPYVKKDVDDIVQRLQNEISCNRQNFHINQQDSSKLNPITHISCSKQTQIKQRIIEQSPINLIGSNLCSSFKKVEPLFSTSNFILEQIQQRIKNQQTKTTIQTNQLIESTHSRQHKFNLDYSRNDQNIKNIFQEPLSNLFEPISKQYRKQSSNTQLFEFQQTLRYLDSSQKYETTLNLQNMNKHQYKIPQLSEDLQQDLRILKAQNEKKRKQNNMDLSQKWSEDILHY